MTHQHGSTGLAGVAYYESGNWPDEYRQSLLVGNVVTSRIHRDTLEFEGATGRAIERSDFLTCDDPWFRPVDVRFGPDGALYIADFYNRIIGHYEVPLDHPQRDRHRGRIWRIVYRPNGERVQSSGSLARSKALELIDVLGDANIQRRYLAVDQLTDRLGPKAWPELRDAVARTGTSVRSGRIRTMARWALHRQNQLTEAMLMSAANEPRSVDRFHAMKMIAERSALTRKLRAIAETSLQDSDANVRRAAADALAQHPAAQSLFHLAECLSRTDANDLALRHSLRIALRNTMRACPQLTTAAHGNPVDWSVAHREQLANVAIAVRTTAAAELLLHYLESISLADTPPVRRQITAAVDSIAPPQWLRLLELANGTSNWSVEAQLNLISAIRKRMNRMSSESLRQSTGQWLDGRIAKWIDSPQVSAGDWRVVSGAVDWQLERRMTNDGRQLDFLSSLPGGERERSRLFSRAFDAPRQLSFEVCGHRGDPSDVVEPDGDRLSGVSDWDPAIKDCYVQLRLIESGKIIRRAFAPRNDRAKRVTWELASYAGQRVRLEVVDNLDHSAYAWLAIAEISPELVRLEPNLLAKARAQSLIAQSIANARLEQYTDKLLAWSIGGASRASRAIAASSWFQLNRRGPEAMVAGLLSESSVNFEIQDQLAQAIRSGEPATIDAAVSAAMESLPEEAQIQLAAQWLTSAAGAERLVSALEQGRVSLRLAARPELDAALEARGDSSLKRRWDTIRANTPLEGDRLSSTIQQTVRAVGSLAPRERAAQRDAGRKVFERSCVNCHQVAGKGALVGPQLDGIGRRGLARLVEDVLASSRNVDPSFRTTVLTQTDGTVLTGLLRRDSAQSWSLIDGQGKSQVIDPQHVDQQRQIWTSIMPSNFSETLSESQRIAVVTYLLGL